MKIFISMILIKNLRVRGLVPQFDKVQLYDPKEAGWSGWKQYLRTISDFDFSLILLLAVTLSYYGLSYISAALPGNLFINNTINGLIGILAYTVLMFSMPFIGRRKLKKIDVGGATQLEKFEAKLKGKIFPFSFSHGLELPFLISGMTSFQSEDMF